MQHTAKNYIIGTAGHIDHGKTALIKALTGINTDRLKEEQERGITIELGFAFFDGTDGHRYGIVDVPGHEKFIPTMLAGAHGFDVVIIVVAAVDGVKPQTIEHFEILHLLKIPRAMFVITKIDMVDEMKIEEVKEEIEILVHGSYLENSKIIPASSITGQGLDDVRDEISRLIGEGIPKNEQPYFRYPIDRAFTITGFGTVVTGTIISGKVALDNEVVLADDNSKLRVRKIEVHDSEVKEAFAGQRAALNLPRIEKTEITRGMELVSPELMTQRYNRYYANIEMLAGKVSRMKNFSRARLFKGTNEMFVTLVNFTANQFEPKGKYIVDIGFRNDCLITSGERFILRDETNKYSIGGGKFLFPATKKRKRISEEELALLSEFSESDLNRQIETVLLFVPSVAISREMLKSMFNVTDGKLNKAINQSGGRIVSLDWNKKSYALKQKLERYKHLIKDTIENYHEQNPESPGIDKHSLRDKLKPSFTNVDEIDRVWHRLIKDGTVIDSGEFLKLSDFKIQLQHEDAELREKILNTYSDISTNPPKREKLAQVLQENSDKVNRIFQGLIKSKELINLATGVYISSETFNNAVNKAVEFLEKNGEITVAQFRDIANTNRNLAVIILETMDSRGITQRLENIRVLAKKK